MGKEGQPGTSKKRGSTGFSCRSGRKEDCQGGGGGGSGGGGLVGFWGPSEQESLKIACQTQRVPGKRVGTYTSGH